MIDRAQASPELRLRVAGGHAALGFPTWVQGDVEPDQVVVHPAGDIDWDQSLATLKILDEAVRARRG